MIAYINAHFPDGRPIRPASQSPYSVSLNGKDNTGELVTPLDGVVVTTQANSGLPGVRLADRSSRFVGHDNGERDVDMVLM